MYKYSSNNCALLFCTPEGSQDQAKHWPVKMPFFYFLTCTNAKHPCYSLTTLFHNYNQMVKWPVPWASRCVGSFGWDSLPAHSVLYAVPAYNGGSARPALPSRRWKSNEGISVMKDLENLVVDYRLMWEVPEGASILCICTEEWLNGDGILGISGKDVPSRWHGEKPRLRAVITN